MSVTASYISSAHPCASPMKITYSSPPPLPAPAAQLRSVQEEMDSLEEEKESELVEAQEELRVAREEVLLLQQAAEEAAAERENDIASLQEELCRRRVELQRLSEETQEYELEITTLRAEISMKSQRREAERREGERQEEGERLSLIQAQSAKQRRASRKQIQTLLWNCCMHV